MNDALLSRVRDRFPCFRDVPDDRLARTELAAASPSTPHSVNEDHLLEHALFVVAGGARIYKICPSTGREMTLYRVLEGQCCPLMMASVLGGSEYEASAAIEAPTEALLVPVPEFKAWIDEFPTVRQFVFKQIAGRIVDVALLAERVAFLPIPVRLADFLLVAARDQSSLRITHDRIAAELGTAREVVSRALQALASQELIRLHHGRVELLRRDLLLRIADSRS